MKGFLPMKVLIADDHELFRDGLRLIVEDTFANSDILESDSFSEALSQIDRQNDIDLALIDFGMPGIDGFNGISILRTKLPSTPIIVVSGREDRETIYDTLRAGASGYIPKSASRSRIAHILEAVFEGGIYFPEDVLDSLHDIGGPRHSRESIIATLTPRQLEVLMLVCKGKSNKEIASLLVLTEGTVKVHLGAIFRSLGVPNRTSAAMLCARVGLEDGPCSPASA